MLTSLLFLSSLIKMLIHFVKYFISFTLFFTIVNNLFSQVKEIKDFTNNNIKTFSSSNHPKNRSLNFSIKYPNYYDAYEMKNEYIVKGFSGSDHNLIYMIGVIKSPEPISNSRKQIVLSKENLKNSVIQISANAIFITYANGFKINEMSASFIDYISNVTSQTKSVIRQYFIVYSNYLLTLSFSVPQKENETIKETEKRFNVYKSFFPLVTKTIIIND